MRPILSKLKAAKIHLAFLLSTLALLPVSEKLLGQEVSALPLFQLGDLTYRGAFRIPGEEFGISNMNYAQGPIAYNADNHSLFMVGHSHQQAIAEFSIPPLSMSNLLGELSMAPPPLQTFAQVLDRTSDENPQNINTIGGLFYHDLGAKKSLLVNAYEYYDAPADNSHSTLVLDDATDLASSSVQGFKTFEGGAGHTSGWISAVPPVWKSTLKHDYLTGQSSGIPIISRTSVGPSAFGFNIDDVLGVMDTIATTTLLDFSLDNPLHEDLDNSEGNNDIWTHLSRAVYGFIVPGTRTYFTIGYSGGHESGVCYKCTDSGGTTCGGYCANNTDDYYQHYWLWDMNDIMRVKFGSMAAHEVRPYEHGHLSTPFEGEGRQVGGGSFDPASGDLYLTIQRADDQQGPYRNPPVVVVYSTNLISAVDVYLGQDEISLYPNPTNDVFEIRGQIAEYQIQILDATGMVAQEITSASTSASIALSELPAGLYFVRLQDLDNAEVFLEKILKR